MDEPREQPAGATGRAPLADQQERLSPQVTRREYNQHTGSCPQCRDIDRGRCATGDRLWRDWHNACDDAYNRLAEELR